MGSRMSSGGGGGGGGSGTVTSVALTVPAELSVAGSPVTSAGTLAVTKANATANRVYAGPTSGGAAQPSMRALVAADIGAVNPSALTGSGTVPAAGLPPATTGALGAVQVGAGLAVDGSGVLSAAFVKLAEVVLSSTAANIQFSAISQAYRTLQLIVQARGDAAATSVGVNVQFNGDTAAHYDWVELYGNNNAAFSDATAAGTALALGAADAASAPASGAGMLDALIPNYAGTTFHKALRSVCGLNTSTAAAGQLVDTLSGTWRSTAAISSILVFPSSGNFVAGSTASLYALA